MSSFASGLAAGGAIKANRRERQERQAKQKSEGLRKAIEDSRTGALDTVKQFTDIAVKLAGSGVEREDDNFKKIEDGIRNAAAGHASVLNELRETARAQGLPEEALANIEDPNAFVENAILTGKASIDAAFAGRPKTITGDDLPPGIPKDAVIQEAGDGKLTMLFKPGEEDDPSKLEMLRASNLGKPLGDLTPEEMANAIGGGRLQIIYDPVTRVATVTDLAGKPVAEPVPVAGLDDPGIVPATADPTQAVGAGGIGRNIINVIGDAFGAGATFPEAEEATVAMKGLQTRTMLILTAPMPGRPSNLIREELKGLTPTPNSLFEGGSRTAAKYRQVKDLVDTEIARLDRALTVGVSPTDQGTMTASSEQLKELSADYGVLLDKFKVAGGEGEQAPEKLNLAPGTNEDDVRAKWPDLTPEQRKLFLPAEPASGNDT